MARETKVGLLAGLAFIICFAIILANGGHPKRATTHWPYLVDQGVNVRRATHDLGSARAPDPRANARNERPSIRQPTTERPTSFSYPVRIDQAQEQSSDHQVDAPASGAEIALPTRPLRSAMSQLAQGQPTDADVTTMDQTGTRQGMESTRRSSHPSGSPQAVRTASNAHNTGEMARAAGTGDWDQRRRALEDLLEARTTKAVREAEASGSVRQDSPNPAASVGTEPRAVMQPARNPPLSKPPPRLQDSYRCKVKPGDTLSRIAFVHYGSRSSTLIDAIFNANRSTLSSPDMLLVGVELVLPVVDGFAGPGGQGRKSEILTTPTLRRVSPRAEAEPEFRWYQINKNDRYVSIAREQLGDANRWRELFELNRDKFPDPDRIRHGVRIKLPLDRVTSTGVRP